MTIVSTHRTCRDCGASFKKSRTDSTVRCIPCRRARKAAAEKRSTR